jgi:galactose-1-phosphate uridylyltransferase
MPESELRQDPMTKDWVAIAPTRATRSHPPDAPPGKHVATHDESCPFCFRNEALTPSAVISLLVQQLRRTNHLYRARSIHSDGFRNAAQQNSR